jgi:hypothetical protein
LERTQ